MYKKALLLRMMFARYADALYNCVPHSRLNCSLKRGAPLGLTKLSSTAVARSGPCCGAPACRHKTDPFVVFCELAPVPSIVTSCDPEMGTADESAGCGSALCGTCVYMVYLAVPVIRLVVAVEVACRSCRSPLCIVWPCVLAVHICSKNMLHVCLLLLFLLVACCSLCLSVCRCMLFLC